MVIFSYFQGIYLLFYTYIYSLAKDSSQMLLMFIPRFSLNSHVKTESLYGMKSVFFFFLLCNIHTNT